MVSLDILLDSRTLNSRETIISFGHNRNHDYWYLLSLPNRMSSTNSL